MEFKLLVSGVRIYLFENFMYRRTGNKLQNWWYFNAFLLFFPRRLSRSWRAVNYIDYIIHVSKFLLKKTSRKFISCKHDNRETRHVTHLKYVLRNIGHGGLGVFQSQLLVVALYLGCKNWAEFRSLNVPHESSLFTDCYYHLSSSLIRVYASILSRGTKQSLRCRKLGSRGT